MPSPTVAGSRSSRTPSLDASARPDTAGRVADDAVTRDEDLRAHWTRILCREMIDKLTSRRNVYVQYITQARPGRAGDEMFDPIEMAHPACMTSFSPPANVSMLRKRLRSIHPSLAEFEVEELILYPAVAERIRKMNLPYRTAHQPDRVPPGAGLRTGTDVVLSRPAGRWYFEDGPASGQRIGRQGKHGILRRVQPVRSGEPSRRPSPPLPASSPRAGRAPACPARSSPAAPSAAAPAPRDRQLPPWRDTPPTPLRRC